MPHAGQSQNISAKPLANSGNNATIKLDYVTVNVKKVLADAPNGTRHGGVYNEAMKKTQHRLEKTIRSRTDTIKEHEDKIAHPEKYYDDWAAKSQDEKAWALAKWQGDLQRNSEQLAIDREVYKARFGEDYEYG